MKLIISTCMLFFAPTIIPEVSHAQDWALSKDEKDIQVYTRKVPGRKMKAFRGVTTINSNIRDIAALFNSDRAYESWLSGIVSSRRLERVSNVEQILHLVQKFPVVKDRDVIVRGVASQDPDTKVLTIQVKDVPDTYEKSKRYVRMPSLVSTFTFTPLNAREIKVVYEVDANPGGSIPGFVANTVAVTFPYKSLAKLRDISQSLDQYITSDVKNQFVNF